MIFPNFPSPLHKINLGNNLFNNMDDFEADISPSSLSILHSQPMSTPSSKFPMIIQSF